MTRKTERGITWINRVFKATPGGLVSDYLGLADDLKQALATYTKPAAPTRRRAIRAKRWR